MDALDAGQVQAVLGAALTRPGGAELVLSALAAVPGTGYRAATPRRLFHPAEPARLTLGEWAFAPADGQSLEVNHTVRGVVLSRTAVPPAEGGRRLAAALLASVADHGSDTEDAARATLAALADVLAL